MAAVNPDSPPPLWALVLGRVPLNAQQCLVALRFLAAHPDQDINWSKQCAELLARTDISALPEAKKITDTLFIKCPILFPRVTVKVGNETRQISKARLTLLSEKFATQLSAGLTETTAQTIDLTGEDPSIALVFLDYLATGKLDITGENATSLFTIADKHDVSPLTQECLTFLQTNLDAGSFPGVLRHAIETRHPDLLWMCLSCIAKNSTIDKQVPPSSPEAVLVARVQPCLIRDLSLSWDSGVRTLTILNVDEFTPLITEALQALHTSCPIRGLDIIHATNLDPLNFIETLDAVTIGRIHKFYATIPENWLQTAKSIHIDCPRLTTLNATNATKITCCCASLTTLNAPNASTLNCPLCRSLTTLNAPTATEVYCIGCLSLTMLNAPKATTVFCAGCTSLTTIKVAKGCVIVDLPENCTVEYVE